MISGLRRFRGDIFRCEVCNKPSVPPSKYCFKCRDAFNEQAVRERVRKSSEPKFLYAISVRGDAAAAIKFGFAVSLEARLKALQIGSPVMLEILASCPGRPHHEKMIHRRMMLHRSHGEWFTRNESTLGVVRMIADGTILDFLTQDSSERRIKHLQVVNGDSINSA